MTQCGQPANKVSPPLRAVRGSEDNPQKKAWPVGVLISKASVQED